MITALALVHWLDTLPAGANVAIDEGGLTLVHVLADGTPGEAYHEIGGIPTPEREPIVTCGICEWHGPESKMRCTLAQVPDLMQRIKPGDEVPAGECPECGGLCYLLLEGGE